MTQHPGKAEAAPSTLTTWRFPSAGETANSNELPRLMAESGMTFGTDGSQWGRETQGQVPDGRR
jgi:hypothetical protein